MHAVEVICSCAANVIRVCDPQQVRDEVMNANAVPEGFETVKVAGDLLGYGRTKVYELINEGKIAAFTREEDGRTLIARASIDDYKAKLAASLKPFTPKPGMPKKPKKPKERSG
ncbi:helix-turn-helix domain-containing protein [Bradyrhizobium sp. Pa8]|uniref:helix-turn-helix domain-containing protein n=1 Tax=Bradyrhizobium sp. Pa8 TaxID=3386552 RepID=UPI00403F4C50